MMLLNERLSSKNGGFTLKRKMNKSTILISILTLLTFALLLASCSSDEESDSFENADNSESNSNDGAETGDELAEEQVLRLAETDEINSMDPAVAPDAISHHTINRVMSGLLIYEDGELVPEIAEYMP